KNCRSRNARDGLMEFELTLPLLFRLFSIQTLETIRNNKSVLWAGLPCILASMQTSPHIVFVEDDREISALVARYLRANDCRVSLAADGREMAAIMAT